MTINIKRGFGLTRRLAVGALGAALMVPALAGSAYAAEKKIIRISTPAADAEWQSKGLRKFKELVEAAALTNSRSRSSSTPPCSTRAPKSLPCSAAISRSA